MSQWPSIPPIARPSRRFVEPQRETLFPTQIVTHDVQKIDQAFELHTPLLHLPGSHGYAVTETRTRAQTRSPAIHLRRPIRPSFSHWPSSKIPAVWLSGFYPRKGRWCSVMEQLKNR